MVSMAIDKLFAPWRCVLAVLAASLLFGSYTLVHAATIKSSKPHIIFIVADDMGFNDVGFHGSNEIPTPNIDALAYNGVILNRHYTQALCTPSRSAFLTGKYPIHLGMQHLVILEPEPWGLGLNETLLPQYLKSNGYNTHAVGKWHLGFFKKEYTPTYRGFDTHYGYWQGLQDYYEHTVHATFTPEYGYDMRRNLNVDWSAKGTYTTELLTKEAVNLIENHNVKEPMFMYLAHLAPHTGNDAEPLQAPDFEIAKFAHIKDPERRIYAAMVSLLDQSVGKVISALRRRRMLDNSIIVFLSDNGAKTSGTHANHGSNYPLRGLKNSAWEGGTRNIAAVWSPLIRRPQRVSEHTMHITDWLPTLFSAAGLDGNQLPSHIDGVDVWRSISEDEPSARTEVLYNIDDVLAYGGIRQGDWKYVYGSASSGDEDQWYGSDGKAANYSYNMNTILNSETGTALTGFVTYQQISDRLNNKTEHELLTLEKIKILRSAATVECPILKDINSSHSENHCNPMQSPCLFNIKDDPCEFKNLAKQRPIIVANMEQALVRYRRSALPIRNVPRDPNADPVNWNNTWTTWQDPKPLTPPSFLQRLTPLTIALICGTCIVFFLLVAILILVTLNMQRRRTHNSHRNVSEPEDALGSLGHLEEKAQMFQAKEMQRRDTLRDRFRTVE